MTKYSATYYRYIICSVHFTTACIVWWWCVLHGTFSIYVKLIVWNNKREHTIQWCAIRASSAVAAAALDREECAISIAHTNYYLRIDGLMVMVNAYSANKKLECLLNRVAPRVRMNAGPNEYVCVRGCVRACKWVSLYAGLRLSSHSTLYSWSWSTKTRCLDDATPSSSSPSSEAAAAT